MKLSEAIRLGAMLKPQGFHTRRRGVETSCALEAAIDAAQEGGHWSDALTLWPWMWNMNPPCPACQQEGRTRRHAVRAEDISDTIWQLNDEHHWTREQIADWVAQIEPPENIEQPDPLVAQAESRP